MRPRMDGGGHPAHTAAGDPLLRLEALHVMSLDDNDFRHFFPA